MTVVGCSCTGKASWHHDLLVTQKSNGGGWVGGCHKELGPLGLCTLALGSADVCLDILGFRPPQENQVATNILLAPSPLFSPPPLATLCLCTENKQPCALDSDRNNLLKNTTSTYGRKSASLTLAGVERKAAEGSTHEQIHARRDQHSTNPIAVPTYGVIRLRDEEREPLRKKISLRNGTRRGGWS